MSSTQLTSTSAGSTSFPPNLDIQTGASPVEFGPHFHLWMEYGLTRVAALYDPGAATSLMRESVLLNFMRTSTKYIRLGECTVQLSAFNSATPAVYAKCAAEIRFSISGHVFTHTFVIVRDENSQHECLLGQDFWFKHLSFVKANDRYIECKQGQHLNFFIKSEKPLISNVKVQGQHFVPPHSTMIIPVVPRAHARHIPIGYFQADDRQEFRIDDAIVYPSHAHRGEFRILYTNKTDETVELNYIHVGTLTEIRDSINALTVPEFIDTWGRNQQAEKNSLSSSSVSSVNQNESEKKASDSSPASSPPGPAGKVLPWKFVIPDNLTETQKQQIFDLVTRHTRVFVKNDEDHGLTNVLEQKIELTDTNPLFVKQYPLEQSKEAALEEIVDRMLATDKVEESDDSPWNTPVLLVPKPKGGYRLVNDFRRLNMITKRQHWPLPRIPELLDKVRGAKWFSSLDMRDAFWQIPIAPEHRPYTTFSTPTRRVRYKVMPMGLVNSSHCFSRLMSIVLRGLPWVLCYIDDVAIYANTFEELIERTEIVFDRLYKAGLKLNGAKTHVGMREAEVLGYVIDEHGMRMHPSKIGEMRKWPKPETKTQLRQFIGFCSFNRRFIRNFARIAYPLTSQLGGRKGEKIFWTREAEDSFEQLKNAMCTDVLAFPDFSLEAEPFGVEVDACKVSEGAVLTQVQDGVKRIIAYASRSFSEAEQKWGITQLEAHAIYWAVAHEFRRYIRDRRFHVFTDHKPCLAMQHSKMANDRLNRWALELQDFDMEMFHVSGKKHVMADAISRLGYLLRSDKNDGDANVCTISLCSDDCLNTFTLDQFVLRAMHNDPTVTSTNYCDATVASMNAMQGVTPPPSACTHAPEEDLPPRLHTFVEADLSSLMAHENVKNILPTRTHTSSINSLQRDGKQLDTVRHAQRNDEIIQWVYDYLMRSPTLTPRELRHHYTRSQPQTLSRRTYQRIAGYARQCFLDENGIVYRRGGLYGKQLFVPQSLKRDFFIAMHDTPSAGHLGINHTIHRMSKRYWWPKMVSDAHMYVASCAECLKRNIAPQQSIRMPVTPEDIPSLFERLAVDVQGEFKKTPRGNRFIVTFIDLHSRWIEAFAVTNIKAKTIAQLFVSQILLRYGPVRSLLSDRGSNFMSLLLRETLHIFNVSKMDIAAYHPESNAKVERVHRLYNNMISKYVSQTHTDWDTWLPFVQHAYRTSKHSATGFTPYELVFGRPCEDFIDVSLFPSRNNIPSDITTWVVHLRKQAQKMRDIAKKMEAQNIEQQLRTAPTREPPTFAIGEKVLLRDMSNPSPGQVSKYRDVWTPGFVVRARSGPTRYDLIRAEDTSANPYIYVRDVTHIKRDIPRASIPQPTPLDAPKIPQESVRAPSPTPTHIQNPQPTIDDAHFIVEKKTWATRNSASKADVEYKVRHKNCDATYDCWYNRNDLKLRFPQMVHDYDKAEEAKRKAEKALVYSEDNPRRSARKKHKTSSDSETSISYIEVVTT